MLTPSEVVYLAGEQFATHLGSLAGTYRTPSGVSAQTDEMAKQTDARLCVTNLSYDPLDRLTGKTYTNCPATAPVSYGYDAGTYGWGQRTSMSDGSGSTAWTYNARGRLTGESKTINGQTYTTQWGYNSADLPVSMTYPDNEIVTHSYKSQMLLNSVIGANTYVNSTTYDEAGRMRQRVLGVGAISSGYSYYPWNTPNGAGRLQSASHGNGGQTLQAFNYTYSAVGNILSLVVSDPLYTETQAYSYDALSRLTAAAVTGGPANYSESYSYNSTTGNLETQGGLTLAYNDANHVHAVTGAGGNAYGYDLNGNQVTRVIGGSAYTLSYDAGSAYTRAVSSIPQKDFNISNLTTSFGPSSIYQIAKFLTNLGCEFVSAGVAGLSITLFPSPKGSKGTYLSPFGFNANPAQPPGAGWVWKGKGAPGSNQGNWVNEETGEWLHYDLEHHGQAHYDYRAPDGTLYRIWSDGSMTPKY
jgi:YD repeat-containing protein